MASILTVDQKIPFTLAFTDSAGNPARVDGVPAVSLSDPAVADLTVAADGLSGEVSAKTVGTVQVQVEADADLGAGIRPVVVTGDLEIVPGEAQAAALTFAAPVAK